MFNLEHEKVFWLKEEMNWDCEVFDLLSKTLRNEEKKEKEIGKGI